MGYITLIHLCQWGMCEFVRVMTLVTFHFLEHVLSVYARIP